ncbi:MAG: ABC transporter ATP-binding protein [Symploca sp. SIO2G7]|nr:ABC transporter ATP-binding protein [Symploca sp. SIO2G7]
MSVFLEPKETEINTDTFLSASHLTKHYFNNSRSTEVLKDICLNLKKGEILSIVGFSGCGKSTLLRLLAGLIPPSQGKIWIEGKTPVAYRKAGKIGFVFQKPVLFDWRTVQENMLLPAEISHFSKNLAQQRALDLLSMVGLEEVEKSYPSQLSGGMRQRVAFARSLMIQPKLLLLDEPFSALDEIIRENLWVDFHQIWQQQELTVVLVTHSIREAVFFADRVLVMSPRPGQIQGEIEISLPSLRNQSVTVHPKFIELCEQVRSKLSP